MSVADKLFALDAAFQHRASVPCTCGAEDQATNALVQSLPSLIAVTRAWEALDDLLSSSPDLIARTDWTARVRAMRKEFNALDAALGAAVLDDIYDGGSPR